MIGFSEPAPPADVQPLIVAVYGSSYLVTLDGRESEASLAVIYDPRRQQISPLASAGSHLKMMNGYVGGFTGDDAERQQVEAEVAKLVRARYHDPP